MGRPSQLLPVSEAATREVDIVPVWRYTNCYTRAIEIMRKSRLDSSIPQLRKIITHRFQGLENVPAALQCASQTHDELGNMGIKVAVNCAGESMRRKGF